MTMVLATSSKAAAVASNTRAPSFPQRGLSKSEQHHLQQLEKVIETAHRYMLELAEALWNIRNDRLYRDQHGTFEEYCQHRWGYSGEQGRRLCQWVEVVRNLKSVTPPIGGCLPLRESHARPLAKLTPAQQKQAWDHCLRLPVSQRTAKVIESVCETVSRTPVGVTPVVSVHLSPKKQEPAVEEGTSPITWYGGKSKLAVRIIELLPAHRSYAEIFFGSGSVFWRKPKSEIEIINDIDNDIVNLFRILRDRASAEKLQSLLKHTPYSRSEHQWCKENPHDDDPIERARRFFVRCRQSYAGVVDDSWSTSAKNDRAGAFVTPVDELLEKVERLRSVQIECQDFRVLLPKCDQDGVVAYLDPPYVHSKRKRTNIYRNEMTLDDHEQMLRIVTSFRRGKIILSGYDTDLYLKYLKKWKKYEVPVLVNASTCCQGQRAKGRRTECLWTNY